jgi:hypothetical protein
VVAVKDAPPGGHHQQSGSGEQILARRIVNNVFRKPQAITSIVGSKQHSQ